MTLVKCFVQIYPINTCHVAKSESDIRTTTRTAGGRQTDVLFCLSQSEAIGVVLVVIGLRGL